MENEKMTLSDFAICLNLLVGAYPGRFIITDDNMVEVWHKFLGEIKNKDLWNVIYEYIENNKYPPSISDLLEIAKQRGCLEE